MTTKKCTFLAMTIIIVSVFGVVIPMFVKYFSPFDNVFSNGFFAGSLFGMIWWWWRENSDSMMERWP